MYVIVDIAIKGGLPVKAHCWYSPPEPATTDCPGAEAEFIVEELRFKSGHEFPIDSLTDKEYEDMEEQAWQEFVDSLI